MLWAHCVFLIQQTYGGGARKKPWAGRVHGGGRLRPRSANTAPIPPRPFLSELGRHRDVSSLRPDSGRRYVHESLSLPASVPSLLSRETGDKIRDVSNLRLDLGRRGVPETIPPLTSAPSPLYREIRDNESEARFRETRCSGPRPTASWRPFTYLTKRELNEWSHPTSRKPACGDHHYVPGLSSSNTWQTDGSSGSQDANRQ